MAMFYEDGDRRVGAALLSAAFVERNITDGYAEITFRGVGEESVPTLVGFGPLGGEYSLLLLQGVGFVADGVGTGELVIWKTESEGLHTGVEIVEEEGEFGVIRMSGELPLQDTSRPTSLSIQYRRSAIRIRFLVDREDAAGQRPADPRDVAIWPERVIRFADARGFYVAPVCPVRREVWPYVKQTIKIGDVEHAWQVTFVGGQVRRYEVSSEDEERWLSIGNVEANGMVTTPTAVAMWPSAALRGWRLYTAFLEEAAVASDGNVEFWGMQEGGETRKRLPHRRRNSQIVAIEIGRSDAEKGIAPSYMVLDKDESALSTGGPGSAVRAGGVFQVLPTSAPIPLGQVGRTVALDIGTTTTVVCGPDPNAPPGPVDLAKPAETTRPFVLVSNEPGPLPLTSFPWIPTVPAACMLLPDNRLIEIPTGLFVASNNQVLEYPFADFTFAGPSFDPLTGETRRQEGRWYPNLKWTADDDDQERRRLEAFVSAVMLWVAGLYRQSSNSVTLRATYPLAFDPPRRQRYASVLKNACRQVTEWTGIEVVSSEHWSGRHNDHPFCDESVALVERCLPYMEKMDRFFGAGHSELDEGYVQIMFHADLGGETLDVLLAIVDGASFRVLAAESTRIGADVLKNNVARKTRISPDNIKDAVLSRFIRIGKLDAELGRVLLAGEAADAKWDGVASVNWHPGTALPLVREFQGWSEIYAGILLEYCARFVAGTLRDKEAVELRRTNGPGRGLVERRDWSKGVLVAVRRSGNGWKFMKERWCAQSDEVWLARLERRTAELLAPEQNRVVVSYDREEKLLSKDIAALGALYLVEEREGLEGRLAAEAAPNGFDDADRAGRRSAWWMQVGEGSPLLLLGAPEVAATSEGGNEPSRGLLRDRPYQVSALVNPPFPAEEVFQGERARRRWREAEEKEGSDERRELVARVQQAAATALNVRYRAKSAASAYWEGVLADRVRKG